MPGARIADGPVRAACPCGGGSVRPWAAKSRLPTTARTKAVTTPEVACPVVDRKVTSTGPTMKTNSSTTDSIRSEEHTSELQSRQYLVCRLLLEKKKKI